MLHIQYQTGAYRMHPAINLLPWRLKGLPGRPAIAVTAHDLLLPYLFPKAGPLRRWVTRRLLADADAVVVTNEDDFRQLARARSLGLGAWRLGARVGIPSAKPQAPSLIPIGSNIPVSPPAGYDRASWRGRLDLDDETVLVAYFGLISRTKGLDALLGALERLPARFRLLVVGGAATAPDDRAFAEEIQRRIAARGLGARVRVTGHCPADEVSAHLLAADLAALPFADGASFRRGSLLATLAHGLPTLTTYPTTDGRAIGRQGERASGRNNVAPSPDHPVAPSPDRWLVDGENVLLVPPGDASALAAALDRLAGDAALRERLAFGGHALAARFSWSEIAAQHEALYVAVAQHP